MGRDQNGVQEEIYTFLASPDALEVIVVTNLLTY